MNYGPTQEPAQSPYGERKARTGVAFWISIVLGVLLLVSIILNVVSFQPIFLGLRAQGGGGELLESTDPQYGDPDARDRIAVISVSGVLVDEDYQTMFGGSVMGPVSYLRAQLQQAKQDENVRAVIIEIDSPGGSVTASDTMHHEIMKFKQEKHVPVIVYVGEMAASGGYYIAAPADCIVASPTAITGSIGVIMSMIDVSGALEYLRIKSQPIISSGCKYKDTGSPTRPLRKDGEDNEEEYLQALVDSYYEQFVKVVYDGRLEKGENKFGSIEAVKQVANGKIYNTQQALANGLVDREGYFEIAYDEAISRAGIASAEVVRYYQQIGGGMPFMMHGGNTPAATGGDINLLKIDAGSLANLPRSQFMYIWQPNIIENE